MSGANKVCLVTGASTGIGRETAIALARQGATVVMVSRDPRRGAAALSEVRTAAGHDRVELIQADLELLSEVRRVAAEFRARHDRLDVLVNNAGVINSERRVTAEGFEATFALNHLAYFLLTHLLLDLLKKSAPSRIINVSSAGHKQGRMHFDDLQGARKYSGVGSYCQSKLANVLFTYELARRLEGTGVTANTLHPGVVSTGFGALAKGWFSWALKIVRPFMTTPEEGAATSIYLATSPDVSSVTGRYFVRQKAARSSRESRDVGVQRRLWEVSEQLTGLKGRD